MPMKTKTPELISSRKAATMLGVHIATFNRWAADGKVPTALQGEGIRGPRYFDPDVIRKMAEAKS